MRYALILAVASLFAAADDPADRNPERPTAPNPAQTVYPLQARPTDTPAAEVCLGDVAPNFAYQGVDGRWRRLRDIIAEGPVLLVFGANEPALRLIEREREPLMGLGVIPVAVVDARLGAARGMVHRLDLRFMVLADAQGTIAAQFNAVDPASGRHRPSWFVLDARRHVRGLGRSGLPPRGYPALAAEALGLPAKGVARPASR